MAIKAVAHLVAVSVYDASNVYAEVRIVAEHNSEPDATNQLFVIPISGNAAQDIRDAVKAWTESEWQVSWDLLDTVLLFGGAGLL